MSSMGEVEEEGRAQYEAWLDANEDGSNRDVPPFDNDPRTDDEIKQEVYDRLSDPDYDDDHPEDWEE